MQISFFLLFSNFQKRQIALFSPGWSVGWQRQLGVTINFPSPNDSPFSSSVLLLLCGPNIFFLQIFSSSSFSSAKNIYFFSNTFSPFPSPLFFSFTIKKNFLLQILSSFSLSSTKKDIFLLHFSSPPQKNPFSKYNLRIRTSISDVHCLLGLVSWKILKNAVFLFCCKWTGLVHTHIYIYCTCTYFLFPVQRRVFMFPHMRRLGRARNSKSWQSLIIYWMYQMY